MHETGLLIVVVSLPLSGLLPDLCCRSLPSPSRCVHELFHTERIRRPIKRDDHVFLELNRSLALIDPAGTLEAACGVTQLEAILGELSPDAFFRAAAEGLVVVRIVAAWFVNGRCSR